MGELDTQRQEAMQAASAKAHREVAARALTAQLDREQVVSRVRTQARWGEALRDIDRMRRSGASDEYLSYLSDKAWGEIVSSEEAAVERVRREIERQIADLDGAVARASSSTSRLHVHRYHSIGLVDTRSDGLSVERKRCRCGAERIVLSKKGLLHRRVLSIRDIGPSA